MKCPKCSKEMFSKYRDGGSVLICYSCPDNMGHDFEIPNPDWHLGIRKEIDMKTRATITLRPTDVEKIIRKYYENAPMEINSIKYNVDKTEDYRGESMGYSLISIDVGTTLVI